MRWNVHQYYVYMLTNRWKNVLYTGVTNSLETRVWQHKNGNAPGFTKKYNCDRLVYYEIFERIEQAIAREKQIKGWVRKKKNSLIDALNPDWNDLAADWYLETPPKAEGSSEGGPSPSSRLRMTESATESTQSDSDVKSRALTDAARNNKGGPSPSSRLRMTEGDPTDK
jgi:putative endonuclease